LSRNGSKWRQIANPKQEEARRQFDQQREQFCRPGCAVGGGAPSVDRSGSNGKQWQKASRKRGPAASFDQQREQFVRPDAQWEAERQAIEQERQQWAAIRSPNRKQAPPSNSGHATGTVLPPDRPMEAVNPNGSEKRERTGTVAESSGQGEQEEVRPFNSIKQREQFAAQTAQWRRNAKPIEQERQQWQQWQGEQDEVRRQF